MTEYGFQTQPLAVFYEKGVLKNFAMFSGKHLGRSLFLIKLQVFMPTTSLKRYSSTGVFL